MKGKVTLADKLVGANISLMKDHKWIPLAFLLNYEKFFILPSEVHKTFGNTDFSNFKKEILEYTEDSNVYINLDKEEKHALKNEGVILQEKYLQCGLSTDEIESRRDRFGPNKIPERKKIHWIFDLIHQLTSLFACLMWAGGVLAIVAYGLSTNDQSNLWLGVILFAVVLITGFFAFFQNKKSEGILDSFKSFQNAKAMVIRNNTQVEVNAVDLVVGDVVLFKVGDKIPADIRVFEANSLTVNNSGLTGESEPVKLTGECGVKGLESPIEAKNIAFFTTLCMSGSGKGIVIRIGKETYMGKIADLSVKEEAQELNIEKEMNYFIKIITIIALLLGVGFFFGSLGIGSDIVGSFAFAIGIIVANVPEGLLTCLTVGMAITANKLFLKNMMVKNIASIETLGAVTCICSDKTGTLTQNRMSVVHLWYDCEIKKVSNFQEDFVVDKKPVKLKVFSRQDDTFKILQFAGICGSASNFKKETPDDYPPLVQARNSWVCQNKNVSDNLISEKVQELKKLFQSDYDNFYKSNIDERATDGDASEAGIIKFFEKVEPIEEIKMRFPQHRLNGEDIKIPFSSKFKSAGFLRKVENEDIVTDCYYLLAFKGAPDFLIKQCTTYMLNGKEYPIDSFFKTKFQEANNIFAIKGQRVLALAYYRLKKSEFPLDFQFKNDITNGEDENNKIPNYPTNQLCLVGLVSMEDPPRVGVKEAIQSCKKAGIKVIMVTGDQTLTAASIAYQIGVIENLDDTPEVLMEKEGLKTLEEAEIKSNVSLKILKNKFLIH